MYPVPDVSNSVLRLYYKLNPFWGKGGGRGFRVQGVCRVGPGVGLPASTFHGSRFGALSLKPETYM